MKKHVLNLTIIFSSLIFFNGCYTEIWLPEDGLPSENVTSEYYEEIYYGDYYTFYNCPWWIDIIPPADPVGSGYIRNENQTTMSLRNEGQGRGTDDGRKILHTNPPSRDESNNNSSSNSTSSNSSWGNQSSSGSSYSNSSSSRSSDNSSMRNDTGSRNSNSGRR
jgi:hypothetical protein